MADIAQEAKLSSEDELLAGAGKLLSHLWDDAWKHGEGTIEGDAGALQISCAE